MARIKPNLRNLEIALSRDAARGARSYLVERSPDPSTESSWTHAGGSTRSYTTIQGLTRVKPRGATPR